MAKTKQQKQDSVAKLSEKLSRAKTVVFADYKGLTMKQLSDLRDKLREVQSEFTITKNTLLDRAVKTSRFPLRAAGIASGDARPTSHFQEPTATLFAYDDEISPIKILVKTLQDAALGKVKSGFLGETVLDETRILQLAALPTKDELRGQTVGVLVAPLQGMISVLNGNLRNLVYALNQIKLSKGGV